MKILAIECSATPCSAAVIENGKILASDFVNVGLTHSQILMPMAEKVVKEANLSFSDIEGFAVSAGPGSFTGIRIGISAVKGLAAPSKKPCVSVSTLYSMAVNYLDTDCIVCAVMDARCNQVYNAVFDVENGEINRICEDRALLCEELAENLKEILQNSKKRVIIVGDGTKVFYPFVENFEKVSLPSEERRFQNAVSVAIAAEKEFNKGNTLSPEEILPVYLRLPQAERELKLKKESLK
jgi:tRNA threonylcarbamoyladenosine biosynthesis protein TsaB